MAGVHSSGLQGGNVQAITKFELTGVIRRSGFQWRSMIQPAMKSDGSAGICTNFIMLNSLLAADPYPIPPIPDVIEKMQGAEFFTLVDLKGGYFQIAIRPQDCHKTAFKSDQRLYEHVRMPIGYKNAPAIFQRIMGQVLCERLRRGLCVCLDDIVLYGKTKAEHDDNAHWVF